MGSDSVSSKRQGKGPAMTPGKVLLTPSKKTKLGQALPAKQAGVPDRKESSGSSSSSDSEEEEVAVAAAALTAAKQIAQPGKRRGKLPVIFETWQASTVEGMCFYHAQLATCIIALPLQERLLLKQRRVVEALNVCAPLPGFRGSLISECQGQGSGKEMQVSCCFRCSGNYLVSHGKLD